MTSVSYEWNKDITWLHLVRIAFLSINSETLIFRCQQISNCFSFLRRTQEIGTAQLAYLFVSFCMLYLLSYLTISKASGEIWVFVCVHMCICMCVCMCSHSCTWVYVCMYVVVVCVVFHKCLFSAGLRYRMSRRLNMKVFLEENRFELSHSVTKAPSAIWMTSLSHLRAQRCEQRGRKVTCFLLWW